MSIDGTRDSTHRVAFIEAELASSDQSSTWLRRMAESLPEVGARVRIGSVAEIRDWTQAGEIDSIQVGRGDYTSLKVPNSKIVEFLSPSGARARQIADFTIVSTRWELRSRLLVGDSLARCAVVPFCTAAVEGRQGWSRMSQERATLGAVVHPHASRVFREAVNRASAAGLELIRVDGSDATFIDDVDVVLLDGTPEDGLLVVEALARGRPCVVRGNPALGVIAELLGAGGVVAQDAQLLAAITELCSDRRLWEKFRQKGLAHAQSRYTCVAGARELLAFHQGVSLGTAPALSLPSYGGLDLGFFHAGPVEPGIANYTVTGGVPEEFEVTLARALLPSLQTILDVGANSGLYCFVAARDGAVGARVWAFEPQLDCCDRLRHAVDLNNWDDKIVVVPLALGDSSSLQELHLSGTGSTLDARFLGNVDLPRVSVGVETLDRAVQALSIPPIDLIKIDVEGFELRVLLGASGVLERDRPIIFVEIASHISSRSYQNLDYQATLDLLMANNYRVWRCRNWKLEPVDRPPPDGVAMYLCIAQEHVRRWNSLLARTVWRLRISRWLRRIRRLVLSIVSNR